MEACVPGGLLTLACPAEQSSPSSLSKTCTADTRALIACTHDTCSLGRIRCRYVQRCVCLITPGPCGSSAPNSSKARAAAAEMLPCNKQSDKSLLQDAQLQLYHIINATWYSWLIQRYCMCCILSRSRVSSFFRCCRACRLAQYAYI